MYYANTTLYSDIFVLSFFVVYLSVVCLYFCCWVAELLEGVKLVVLCHLFAMEKWTD